MESFWEACWRILITVALSAVLAKLARALTQKLTQSLENKEIVAGEQSKRVQTLSRILNNTATIAIWTVAAIIVLGQLGIRIGPILAGVGILGLAVGFGAQSLVKDLITGFFLLLENQFNVGDVIQAAGTAGVVESFNLRVTVLRDGEGKVHYIPNSEIRVLSNMTKEYSRCMLDIGVAYKENVDRVMEVLKEIGEGLYQDENFKDIILEPLEILGVDAFQDSQVLIKIRFKTKPIKQWTVARELRRRIKNVFDEKGIELPFPHRTVYIGTGEQGNLNVKGATKD